MCYLPEEEKQKLQVTRNNMNNYIEKPDYDCELCDVHSNCAEHSQDMNYIEKQVSLFEEQFKELSVVDRVGFDGSISGYDATPYVKDFLRSSLTSLLEEVMEALPEPNSQEEIDFFFQANPTTIDRYIAGKFTGFNDCRQQFLDNLKERKII